MPIYNRVLNCWVPNYVDFVTSDEEYDGDEYEIDYPSDSEADSDEEEYFDCYRVYQMYEVDRISQQGLH